MKSRARVLIFAVVLAFVFTLPLSAHRGMTDANGGHWDNSTGDYHYHCGGNPPHDHIGGRCPYDRIPAETPNYSDDYGNDTSVTRKEEPMDGWVVFLIVVGAIAGIIFIGHIVGKIKDSVEAPRIEAERQNSQLKAKNEELRKTNQNLIKLKNEFETNNTALLKSLNEYKDRLFACQEENRRLTKENNLLLAQVDSCNTNTKNTEIEALEKKLEKKEQRIDILETKNRNLELQYSGFREASLKGFKAEAWNAFFRKTEKVLKNKYDFDRFFESAESGRLDSALADTVHMNSIEFYAEFEPHSDKTADKYETSLNGCTCKDYKFSKDKKPCKHMLYLAYSIGALQLNAEKFEKTKGRLIKAVRSNSLKNKVLVRNNKKLTNLIKSREGELL